MASVEGRENVRTSELVKWLGGLLLTALLLSKPQAAAGGAARAMARWYETVAPSLFPFLALMPLLTGAVAAQVYERLLGRPMGALFALPGAAAPAMLIGMACGTPAGVVAARSAAARSGMNRGQLHRVATAVTGFSPAFLLGGIGAGMFGSARAGALLLAAQLMTQTTLALLLRGAWRDRAQPVDMPDHDIDHAPVRGAVMILLTIGGYMALFGSVAVVLSEYIGGRASNALLCLLDVPSGALALAESGMDDGWRLVLISGMCGFGGLCLIAQNLGALKGCGVRLTECLALRALAAGISMGYMALLVRLPGVDADFWIGRLRANPLATAGLAAALLAVPALIGLRKTIS